MGEWSFPLLRPMLATVGQLPKPPGWAYEFKWDGVRAIAYVNAGRVQLASRNDRDITAAYPELASLSRRFPRRRAVLDGEIVALDPSGRPSFSLLQQRMHVRTPSAGLRERVPVQFYVFDLLHLGASALLDRPFTARRAKLDTIDLDDETLKTPPYWTDGEGADLLNAAAEIGLEGVVAKRLDSPYQPGTRSRQWIKTPLNNTVEVIIGGWAPGEGRRSGTIGSLILGMYDEQGELRFVGNVGTGFTQQALRDLKRQWNHYTGRPHRSPHRFLANTHGTRPGSNRSWSARSPTEPSPPTGACATRHGAVCDPTANPRKSRPAHCAD